MRLMVVGIGRNGPPDGRKLGPTGTWAQVEDSKRGKPDGRRQAQAHARNSFGPTGMVGKRRRAVEAGGQGSRPGGQSLRDWAIGGEENQK